MPSRLSAARRHTLRAVPIYEYRCKKGHSFEVFQSMSEDPVAECIECGAACERVLSAPAVHFKGSGFYTTDYARKGAEKAASDGGESTSTSKASDSDSKSSATEKSSSTSKSSDD
jgi:putative FmdB family regulatory protein